MDPITIMAIASFAYSVYSSSKRGSGDPMDAIVGMLVEINKKLSIINDKLDVIYGSIVNMPDKIEYKRRVNDLISVANRIPVLYENLKSDIDQYGSTLKGKIEFKRKNEVEIRNYLDTIRLSFQVLKSENDILTIALLANACQIDYELSNLINLDTNYVKSEQKVYLKYLKNAVWEDLNGLESRIKQSNDKLDSVIAGSFLIDWRFHVCTSPRAHEEIAEYKNERLFTYYLPVFKPLILTPSQNVISNNLAELGYLDIKYFNNELNAYGEKVIPKIPDNYTSPITIIKKEISFDHKNNPRLSNNEYLNNKSIVKYIEENQATFENEQNNLIALSSAHNLAVNTIKHINFRVI
jgi:hypothetical protein